MARKATAPLLDAGDTFPALELTLTDGRRLSLPGDLSRPHNVVLVNRGAWCPYCVAQLKAFQSGLAKLVHEDIGVVSVSADPCDQASAVVAELHLEFPVACGASVDTVAEALGVYYDPHPTHTATPHLQAAGFVLGPGGTVLLAVYSSGAIGRLAWQDVLGFVKYVRSHS
jgi:peroxiredoxin